MRSILRGFIGGGFEALFPRPKKTPEAGVGSVSEQLADVIAGIQAGFGKEAADTAIAEVSRAFPHPPEGHSPATEYLNSSLVRLASQHDTAEVLASLHALAEDKT